MSSQRPFVSILTPTYNRRLFFPALLRCIDSQTYPKNRLEWILLDDGTDSIEDLVKEAQKTRPHIRYIRSEEKLLIGKKRNMLNDAAKGDIMVAMDDDDYYPPERVAHVVHMLLGKPKVELAGASEIYMYFADNREIYRIGPYNPNHCTNGTMAYKKSYLKDHRYDETVSCGEEKSFLDNYVNPMVQLDPFKTMLVISHSMNTFDKRNLRTNTNPMFKRTDKKIREFIRDAKQREFYLGLTDLYTPEQMARPIELPETEEARVAKVMADHEAAKAAKAAAAVTV
jgi:glycosyltransferase involved in cell wall biosynthesis